MRASVQKVRQARIHMAKTASRNAFLANKRRFEARLRTLQANQQHHQQRLQLIDEDGDSFSGDDVFQLQHHHLLACLEHTTVMAPLSSLKL